MKVNEIITNKIIEKLEQGIIPWQKHWSGTFPKNYLTDKEYQGINFFLLSMTDFESFYWLTFKQINQLGGHLKKGSQPEIIVYYQFIEKLNEDNEPESYPILKYYRVFNYEQTEGIKLKVIEKEVERIVECEDIIGKLNVNLKNGEPAYSYKQDIIFMPNIKNFIAREYFYDTFFHELGHWTGHESRLNRLDIKARFGDKNYAKEELIAEMFSAFLCNMTGIYKKVEDNVSAYIGNWIKKIKDNNNLVISAASQAQKAYNFIQQEITNV
jgi:antirestriction protein ArdC